MGDAAPRARHEVGHRNATHMVVEALERVGLSPVELFLTKYPRDLSGGQKQRVVMARAIVLEPELLVADEPISMLDMSVRAKILQLMLDLKNDLGLTYVYITHDLATAKFFCDRIAIMYLGPGGRDRADRGDLRATRATPTPRRCWRRSRNPTPTRWSRATCRGARSRTPPSRPWAARSTRGARRRWRPAGGSRGTCETSSRSTGCARTRRTTRSRRSSATSSSWTPRPPLRRSGTGGSAEVRAILERMKAEDTSEPLWSGVTAIEDAGSGVTVFFEPAPSPPAAARGRRGGGVRALPRGRRRRRGLNPHRCLVVVPATNGDPDPRGRMLVSSPTDRRTST